LYEGGKVGSEMNGLALAGMKTKGPSVASFKGNFDKVTKATYKQVSV
jgi:hypothetical protein